jgi:serine/threonine protein kinase
MVIINPKYEFLREKIETISTTFNTAGNVIYKDRNEIRCMSIAPNLDICVKRFQRCSFFNQILCSLFRLPKAIRAYTNAIRINELGPFTPEPIACIIETHKGFITDSYLITKQSNLQHTFYEFRDGDISGKEDLIASFAKWAADLHAAGILHKDFSPGNILYDKVDNVWKFEMVDINRVSFQHISKKWMY